MHDNGSGVAEEQRSLISDKFRQRCDTAIRAQGTDQGLLISHQTVEHFGGLLWLGDAIPGGGASFVFCLPWQVSVAMRTRQQDGDKQE